MSLENDILVSGDVFLGFFDGFVNLLAPGSELLNVFLDNRRLEFGGLLGDTIDEVYFGFTLHIP